MSLEPIEILAAVIVVTIFAAVAAYAIKKKGWFSFKFKSGEGGREFEMSGGGAQELAEDKSDSANSDGAGTALGDIKDIEVLKQGKVEKSNVNLQFGHTVNAPSKKDAPKKKEGE